MGDRKSGWRGHKVKPEAKEEGASGWDEGERGPEEGSDHREFKVGNTLVANNKLGLTRAPALAKEGEVRRDEDMHARSTHRRVRKGDRYKIKRMGEDSLRKVEILSRAEKATRNYQQVYNTGDLQHFWCQGFCQVILMYFNLLNSNLLLVLPIMSIFFMTYFFV